MTKEQIRKLITDNPRAINMVPSSHLGDLPDLVEAHAEIFTLKRSDCVRMYDKDGSSFMMSAVAIKGLALAAGASSYNNGPQSRKEGPTCWVGNAQFYRMGPDGKNEDGPACEKEWDAELQLKKLEILGKKNWKKTDNGGSVPDGTKPYTKEELDAQMANFITTGRERANTGAQSRAIMGLLGQPRALKGLFPEKGNDDDTCHFIVSRIIWNTKNKMLAERMLDNMAGNVKGLYGPQAPKAIEGTVTRPGQVANAPDADDFSPDFSPDLPAEDNPDPEPSPQALHAAALQDLLDNYGSKILSREGVEKAQAAIDSKDDETIVAWLNGCKSALEKKGIPFGGQA